MAKPKFTIETMTADAFQPLTETAEFRAMTPNQKAFVRHLFLSGNVDGAFHEAYPNARGKNWRIQKAQVLKSDGVRGFLEAYKWTQGVTARPALIAIIREQLLAATPGSQAACTFAVQLERLTVGVRGTNTSHGKARLDPNDQQTEPQPPEFFVGQRVTQRGVDGIEHVGVVAALDENGRPSKVEPVDEVQV